ncbi:hypothetical protein HK105_207853 [Polyrhizophydium stewartii]|uniref:Extradiol ring-cleavage dioxygenase class III enzyme subunit B domain-containing protein n=1 Tax=Polyrhizophydium stewartii TaxID=2732419 RepID=A0ABR4MZC8_9FUNG
MSGTWTNDLLLSADRAAAAPAARQPVIFLAHGSPALIWPKSEPARKFALDTVGGPDGPHVKFLQAYGPHLLKQYKPKALVVFSAHWETDGPIQVTDNKQNPLYYDYYGFPEPLYNLDFRSEGSTALSNRIVELLNKSGIPAEKLPDKGRGLDHGVFVPFIHMLPNPVGIPIVEVSMHSNLDPKKLIDLGKAVAPLRDEGVLIISGGLTIHSFREPEAWDHRKAPQGFKDFENAVKAAINENKTPEERNAALIATAKHPYFRRAHPREEHFVPIFIAAGAGSHPDDTARVVCDLHGAITAEFGN